MNDSGHDCPGCSASGTRRGRLPLFGAVLSILAMLVSATWVPRIAGAEHRGAPGSELSEPDVADQYLVRQWTTQHGLPQNTVTCIEQTPDGYLWMGTRYGLVRSDGLRMALFLQELDDVATDAVDVRQLVADGEGTLWVLTRQGLFAYRDGRFLRRVVTLSGRKDDFRVDCVSRSRRGGLWIAGPAGVAHLWGDQVQMVVQLGRAIEAESVSTLFEDGEGRLWLQLVIGLDRGWIRWDARQGKAERIRDVLGMAWAEPGERLHNRWEFIHTSADGRLWVVSPDELICMRPGGGLLRLPAGEWRGRSVRGLCEDREGNLWITTEGAASLHRFDGKELLAMQRLGQATLASDLRSMLLDREGNLWLGSGNAGAYRIQPRPLLARRPVMDQSREEVFTIVPRREGGAWLGTLRGLVRLGPSGAVLVDVPVSGKGMRCKPVLEDRLGRVWVGEFGSGVARHDGNRWHRFQLKARSGSGDLKVRCLFEDSAGVVWAGTEAGLLRSAGDELQWVERAGGMPVQPVLAMAETPDGTLWFGTDRGGLANLRNGKWQILTKQDGLLHDRVWPLAVEPNGALWVGTPLGLNRIRDDRIASVTTSEGLADDLVYSLLDDGHGWYWSHGNHGLSRMRVAQLNAVADGRESYLFAVRYDEADGMESTEGNGDEQPSAARLGNGELWFPTTRGAVIVDPARLRDPGNVPLTVVERMVAGGCELLGLGHAPIKSATDLRARPLRLRVRPEQRSLVEFHYTSPSFVDAERMRFKYRMVGLEDGWNDAGSRRVAYYTALPPGDYRFEVMAGNRFGIWGEQAAIVDLRVEPYFRETWTFRALTGAFGFIAISMAWLWQTRHRERIEVLHRQQALDAERSRIARDLHDELGAGLVAVAMKVEFARGLATSGQRAEDLLDQTSRTARDLVAQLRAAVWALTPQCDSLESLVSFLSAWVEDFATDAKWSCRLDVPENLPFHALSAETRHGLVLAVKEAVTNAIRHSRGDAIRLVVRVESGCLVIEIHDNGEGFETRAATPPSPPVGARGGSGLSNMQLRMEALRGGVEVRSVPAQGTTIAFRLPLARYRP